MGEELPLARSEEAGRSVLLAITGDGEVITTASRRDKRKKKSASSKVRTRRAVKDTKAESQSSSEVEGADASTFEEDRCRRGNQDWESDRGDEGEDKPAGRSAQELGITFPGSYCDEAEIVPHYWTGVDRVFGGSLLQCKLCRRHLWLPIGFIDADRLGILIRRFGRDMGYCYYLNKHRGAKMLVAKLQDLRRLETEYTWATTGNKRKFARMVDIILSDKDYDRKEVL